MHVQRMVLLPDDFDVDVDGCMGLATDHGVDRADWADLLRTFAANGEQLPQCISMLREPFGIAPPF